MELTLNDFEGFDRFLFGEGERDFISRFLIKKDGLSFFDPPIRFPRTIEEYQLNHYALWMSIAHIGGMQKLPVKTSTGIETTCYACLYADTVRARSCSVCPIKDRYMKDGTCGEAYTYWNVFKNSGRRAACYAKKVATLEWRETRNLLLAGLA